MSEVEIMPNLDGITGYFDMSSVDLTNNKWSNLITGGYDMDLINGGAVENDALYLTAEQYGEFQMEKEPQTIYCMFKVITPTNNWTPIAGKMTTTTSGGYALSLHCNTSNKIAVVTNGNELNSSIYANDYHVACITRDNKTAYLYIDGTKIGTITAYTGNYGGYCYINRYYRNGFMHTPTDVKFKMCAFGYEYHSEDIVNENSTFIKTGEKLKYLRLAGTDAVAIAYAIARNQESAAALQEISKSFKDGVREGNDTVVDKTEPIPNDDDEIVIAGDGDDTFPGEFERGGIYIKTKEITVTDDDGNDVTGVFQLHIGLGEMTWEQGPDGRGNWGIPPKVTLTGNGISKTLTFTQGWKGSTSASAPGATDGNEMWMTSAKISKSYPGITGVYYWEYGGSYANRSWKFTGDFATALQNGDYVSTLPFDDVI